MQKGIGSEIQSREDPIRKDEWEKQNEKREPEIRRPRFVMFQRPKQTK